MLNLNFCGIENMHPAQKRTLLLVCFNESQTLWGRQQRMHGSDLSNSRRV
jgi:hypothetical protein